MRTLPATLCLVVALWPGAARGQEAARLIDALQEVVETTIAAAEVSIASIVVSRSDDYGRWGAAPPSPTAGKLGRFNAEAARHSVRREDRDRLYPAILALDLTHQDHVPESYGSGLVIDGAGLILTNAHVVRNATKVYVRLPGTRGSYADIHASDPRSDLAVLRLLDPPGDLKVLKYGDGGKARKGQMVVVLSNPFAAGFRDGSPSAAWGIIANLRRRVPGQGSELERDRQTLHHFGTLLQVDTRLSLGSSGGALLNLKGELLGITTALAALTGTDTAGGFAIPVDAGIRRIIEVLKSGKEVEYGFLGVRLYSDRTQQRGVQIQAPITGSPAQKAGLLNDDLIVGLDGVPINDNDDLFLLVGTSLAGKTVRLDVLRQGTKRTIPVKLAKYYVALPSIAANRPPPRAGLWVDYASILSQRLVLPWVRPVPEGVVIREVVPNSPAARANLQPDKVITRVNNLPVTTPAEFYAAMEKAGPTVKITILDSEGREEEITLDNTLPTK